MTSPRRESSLSRTYPTRHWVGQARLTVTERVHFALKRFQAGVYYHFYGIFVLVFKNDEFQITTTPSIEPKMFFDVRLWSTQNKELHLRPWYFRHQVRE